MTQVRAISRRPSGLLLACVLLLHGALVVAVHVALKVNPRSTTTPARQAPVILYQLKSARLTTLKPAPIAPFAQRAAPKARMPSGPADQGFVARHAEPETEPSTVHPEIGNQAAESPPRASAGSTPAPLRLDLPRGYRLAMPAQQAASQPPRTPFAGLAAQAGAADNLIREKTVGLGRTQVRYKSTCFELLQSRANQLFPMDSRNIFVTAPCQD